MADAICITPTPAEFVAVGRKIIPYRRSQLEGLKSLLPTKYVENTQIILNRPDIIRGLQPWRGNGQEPPVQKDNYNRHGRNCVFNPGYWGETKSISEFELARSAEPVSGSNWTPGQPLDARNEISRIQSRQTVRMLYRMEKSIWDTLLTGRYVAMDEAGQQVDEQFFAVQHVRPTVDWDDTASAAPLATLRSLPELFRGSSASFLGEDVQYWMNITTLNRLLENRNTNDIGRGAVSACCNTVNLGWVNGQLAAQGLGKIYVYDNRWVDERDNVHLFLPDGYVLVIGKRPDTPRPGNYYLTKVINNGLKLDGNDKGIWYFLRDHGQEQVSKKITVGTGHNGGPIIEYPEMVISIKVF